MRLPTPSCMLSSLGVIVKPLLLLMHSVSLIPSSILLLFLLFLLLLLLLLLMLMPMLFSTCAGTTCG